MRNMRATILWVAGGGLAGFAYYWFVGCTTGV